jgi:hypothetical protein
MTYTKKQLMNLPKISHETINIYDSIFILNSGKKHDSGWANFYVIGGIEGKPTEIISDRCDSIFWQNCQGEFRKYVPLHMDMEYPSGAVQFFGCMRFKIRNIGDTVEIQIIEKKGG